MNAAYDIFINFAPMNRKGIIALSPIGIFLMIYAVSGVLAGDFYQVPISVVFTLT